MAKGSPEILGCFAGYFGIRVHLAPESRCQVYHPLKPVAADLDFSTSRPGLLTPTFPEPVI